MPEVNQDLLPVTLLELLFSGDRDQFLQGQEMLDTLRPLYPEQAAYLDSFVQLHGQMFVFRGSLGQYVLDQGQIPQILHSFLRDHVKANL